MKPSKPSDALRITPLAVFLIWTAYGVLLYTQMRLVAGPAARPPWQPYGPIAVWIGSAWAWAAVTPLVIAMVRRFKPRIERPVTLLPHLGAFAVIHAIMTMVDGATFYLVAKQWPAWPLAGYQNGLVQSALLYTAIALAVLALDHARLARTRAAHAAQLEADLSRARLETLRRQIQPHFLFNTLNTISELIDTDPARAGEMVARLGTLLRRSLDDQEQPFIPLRAELEFVTLYTDIERVRFESWLDVTLDIEPAALDAWVPPMILQPLVENAIKHGIAPAAGKGTITISAGRQNDRLSLEVIDDGVGLGPRNGNGHGIGLRTMRERLNHMFSGAAELSILQHAPRGTRVRVDVPFITTPAQYIPSRPLNFPPQLP